MSIIEPGHWRELNDRYVSAAVAWVRALLTERVSCRPSAANGAPALAPRRGVLARIFGHDALAREETSLTKIPSANDTTISIADAEAALKAIDLQLEAAGAAPALRQLAELFGLSPFEQRVVLLCLAFELDTRIGSMCGQIQDRPERDFPTFGLAMSLFPDSEWIAIPPERALRRYRLIEFRHPPGTPLVAAQLRLEETVLHYLRGVPSLDERLATVLRRLEQRETAVSESHRSTLARLTRSLPSGEQAPSVIQLLGGDLIEKMRIAGAVARERGWSIFRVSAEALPTANAEIDEFARLWQRDSALFRLALFVDADDLTSPDEPQRTAALARLLLQIHAHVFIAARESLNLAGVLDLCIEVPAPSPRDQRENWLNLLPARIPHCETIAGELSRQFTFDRESIADLVRTAENEGAATAPGGFPAVLWRNCRERSRPRVERLAQRIDVKATWDDLVVSSDRRELLQQIRGQARARWRVYDAWGMAEKMNRGLGISALFAGESGTGKTMAAEVLACDLGLDLYRVDLSSVVNKYIGETEKHLRRLFDAFESCGALLLIDECDALFGKRTEVKDSHDRYANIETNYLLQRLESYGGLAIMATNNRGAIDTAFLRRIRFVINFAMPTAAERALIWQRLLASRQSGTGHSSVPTGALDYDRLAQLPFSGGNIQNVAINGTFRAAARGESARVEMRDLLAAARDEYLKLGRPIDEADFRYLRHRSDEEAAA
jgi:hypothetical protein